jgi:hypothetical protein
MRIEDAATMSRELYKDSIAGLGLFRQGLESFNDIQKCWLFVILVVHKNSHETTRLGEAMYVNDVVLQCTSEKSLEPKPGLSNNVA